MEDKKTVSAEKDLSGTNMDIEIMENDLKTKEEMYEEEDQDRTKKKKSLQERLFSSIRQRKRSKKASTQRYIPISEIRNDTVILKNNGLRAVLEAEPLNFNLKSEDEQEGIFARYQNFLNSLNFPVQIVITSTKVNIDPYIQKIRTRASFQTNKMLQKQSLMYAQFIEKLVDVADIMQKNFYIVVPQDDQPAKQNTLAQFFTWFKTDDSSAKISQRNQRFHQRSILLRDRMNLVQASLHHVGITTKRLNTQELIELYYRLYNPRSSQEQKLSSDLNTDSLVL